MADNGAVLEGNGHLVNPARLPEFVDLVSNVLSTRQEFLKRFMDPRRNIDDDCGYPDTIGSEQYQRMYDRDPIAARVVEVLPDESWQSTPTVYEDEDAETATDFEEAWDALGSALRGEHSWYADEEGSPVWDYLRRLDVVSGIGQYGILLLGVDDGRALNQPVEGVQEFYSMPAPKKPKAAGAAGDGAATSLAGGTSVGDVGSRPGYTPFAGVYALNVNRGPGPAAGPKSPPEGGGAAADEPPARGASDDNEAGGEADSKEGTTQDRKLMFLRVFPEAMAQVIAFETNPTSPRFARPTMYQITLNDPRDQGQAIGLPTSTVNVHWTRVVHVADNLLSSETFGVPRQKPVFNSLMNLQKLYGGSAEMYWRGAFPGISLETHPQLGGDVKVNQATIRDEMEQYMNSLQRYITLMGMSAKTLSPQVVDPTPQIEVQLTAICIRLKIPKRIFMGSERGELASSQDQGAWNDRMNARRESHITPRVIMPFVDRLIMLGCLPEPSQYSVTWPDVSAQTDAEQASVAAQRTTAMSTYVAGNVESLMAPLDFLTREMGYTEDEAKTIIDNAAKAVEEKQAEEQQQAMEQQKAAIDAGLAPDPTQPQQVHVDAATGKPLPPHMQPPAGAPPFGGKPGFGKGGGFGLPPGGGKKPGAPAPPFGGKPAAAKGAPPFGKASQSTKKPNSFVKNADDEYGEVLVNRWVTLEDTGQHVWIGEDGTVRPSGPAAEEEKKEPATKKDAELKTPPAEKAAESKKAAPEKPQDLSSAESRLSAAKEAAPGKRSDAVRGVAQDLIKHYSQLVEFQDGLVATPFLYAKMKERIPNISHAEFKKELQTAWDKREVELHVDNDLSSDLRKGTLPGYMKGHENVDIQPKSGEHRLWVALGKHSTVRNEDAEQLTNQWVTLADGRRLFVTQAFCATGPGGGVDPSCSPGDTAADMAARKAGAAIAKEPHTPPPPGKVYKPDVTADHNGDGVADHARVGVPAMAVPPPPAIPKLPNLTVKERAVETGFAKAFERDPRGMAAQYRNIAVSATKPGEPVTFATDDAKVLSTKWSSDKLTLEQRSANRAMFNVALHQTANALAKHAFLQHLDTLRPGDEVTVTAGGCGAGKGYSLKNVPAVLAVKDRSKAVWDSAGDQNATEHPWVQAEAEKRGLKVNYVYVHADPKVSWADEKRGAVQRAQDPKDGRMVDAHVFADSYALGAKNHEAFADKHRDNPMASFHYIDSSDSAKGPTLVDKMPAAALKVDARELLKFAHGTIAEKSERIPPHVKRGALVGQRIWKE